MDRKVCIVYSTIDGQTLKICQRISDILESKGYITELFEVTSFDGSISQYSKLIIGASIRYGKHNKSITRFIQQHRRELDKIDTAFFSVNLVARNIEKRTYETNPYVIKYFKQIDWRPKVIEVFAGLLDYDSYHLWDRLMIKLIMRITNGPTKSNEPIEYTDWDQVKDFTTKVISPL